MGTTFIKTRWQENGVAVALAPLVVLPTLAFVFFARSPAWQLMWLLAISIYAGLKWLTIATSPSAWHASTARVLGYLVLWPGMNVQAFLDTKSHGNRPTGDEALLAIFNLAGGVFLLFAVAPHLIGLPPPSSPVGWEWSD